MDTQSTALATREQLNEIAQHDPATAWLYTGGKRLSINNDTRNGFMIKSGGSTVEELSELRALIGSLTPLNSHKQPGDRPQDKGKPRHEDNTEWCESRDGKHTSTNGISCEGCPAYAECKWKIELEMILADREEQYLLTIPTASAIRFKQAAQKLAQIHKRHYSQALWRMWVTVEKSNGNSFPVVNYQVFDLDSGAELSLAGTPNETVKSAKPTLAKPPFKDAPQDNPFSAEASNIANLIRGAAAKVANGGAAAEKMELQRIAAVVNKVFETLPEPERNAIRHAVYSFVIQREVISGKDLTHGLIEAMLQRWEQAENPFYPNETAQDEVNKLATAYQIVRGQQTMALPV